MDFDGFWTYVEGWFLDGFLMVLEGFWMNV